MSNTAIISSVSNFDSMFELAQDLIKKQLVPFSFKTPQQIITAISMGRSLGMDEITSLNCFDVIQGTPAIKSKVIPGLLARKGVAIQVLKDYEPVYFTRKVPIKSDDGKIVIDENGQIKYYKDENGEYITEQKEIDRVTTIKVIRYFENIGVVENEISFHLSQAKSAGWFPDKENWVKLTAYMMMSRCISRAARIAASDLISGLYDEYEVLDSSDLKYTVDVETGEIKVD